MQGNASGGIPGTQKSGLPVISEDLDSTKNDFNAGKGKEHLRMRSDTSSERSPTDEYRGSGLES
jgi:hypothetical protein